MPGAAKFQTATLASPPSGLDIGIDVIGAGVIPVAGQGVPYSKIDVGAAGSSSPLVRGQLTKSNSLPVTLASDSDVVSTVQSIITVGATFARPADVLPYVALDAVNNSASVTTPTPLTFAGASRIASGYGFISKAQIYTDNLNCSAQFRLWLFSVSTAFASFDNAQYLIKYTDRVSAIGYIDFIAMTTEGASDCAQTINSDLWLGYQADAASSIYGLLQTRSAWTPTNAQNILVNLTFNKQ